jgi:ParB-like chromosome segregation protein Spo0J
MNKKSKQSDRRIEFIDIQLIKVDRYPINPKTLSLIDYIRNGGEIPPIKVVKLPKGGFMIKDGRHRLVAYKMLGKTKIKAKFSDIPIYNHNRKFIKILETINGNL